jgi:hypothetical protein
MMVRIQSIGTATVQKLYDFAFNFRRIKGLDGSPRGMVFAESGLVRALGARVFPISGHIPTIRRDQWQ